MQKLQGESKASAAYYKISTHINTYQVNMLLASIYRYKLFNGNLKERNIWNNREHKFAKILLYK